jgi:hypothetical protein
MKVINHFLENSHAITVFESMKMKLKDYMFPVFQEVLLIDKREAFKDIAFCLMLFQEMELSELFQKEIYLKSILKLGQTITY